MGLQMCQLVATPFITLSLALVAMAALTHLAGFAFEP
jgi:hypothetical protein